MWGFLSCLVGLLIMDRRMLPCDLDVGFSSCVNLSGSTSLMSLL